MESELLYNDDVIYRIMSLLGPRHVCIGLGSTCRRLREVATSDTVRIIGKHCVLLTLDSIILSFCLCI